MLVRSHVTGQLHDIPEPYLSGPYENITPGVYDGLGFSLLTALEPIISSLSPAIGNLLKGQSPVAGEAPPGAVPPAETPGPATEAAAPARVAPPLPEPAEPLRVAPPLPEPDVAPANVFPGGEPILAPVRPGPMFMPFRPWRGRRRRILRRRVAAPFPEAPGMQGYGWYGGVGLGG